jgi:heat shock protein 4
MFNLYSQGKMIMQDKLEKERNDAKNAVEEYVYEMRDKLSGEYEKFVNEDVCVCHSVSCLTTSVF